MPRLQDKSGYLSEDTIAAIATASGGAISIVRVSGPLAADVLGQVTQNLENSKITPRRLTRGTLFLENHEKLDDVLLARFVAPQSYTGEDLVEYHLHGGNYISHRFMERLYGLGIRQALPGEFSFRAVRNGKMSLYQAQAVADLISASNDNAISLALEKMSGSQNAFLEQLAKELRETAVLGEVGIDFADQDIDEVSLHNLKKKVASSIQTLEKLKSSYSRGTRLQDGVRVVFAGLPNAGKSSFFNILLGEDRSIVSEIAGTTRDVVRESLTLRGQKTTLTLRLEDTAGLRNTDHSIEKVGIERTRKASRQADLVLFLVDPLSSLDAAQEQWDALNLGSLLPEKTIGIVTKADEATPQAIQAVTELFGSFGLANSVVISSLKGTGISEAVEAIVEHCESWTRREPNEIILTRMDHLRAVDEALTHLRRALTTDEIDLFAADMRQSLLSLSPLIGETLPDDLLTQIFSDFCIGK